MWWSPESARWQGTSPKAAGLVNRPRWAGRRQAKGGRAKRGGAAPSAVWPGIALGVIDRGPAANGVDRSTSYDTPRLKLPAIGKITYLKRV
jgi:hypothetical protein